MSSRLPSSTHSVQLRIDPVSNMINKAIFHVASASVKGVFSGSRLRFPIHPLIETQAASCGPIIGGIGIQLQVICLYTNIQTPTGRQHCTTLAQLFGSLSLVAADNKARFCLTDDVVPYLKVERRQARSARVDIIHQQRALLLASRGRRAKRPSVMRQMRG